MNLPHYYMLSSSWGKVDIQGINEMCKERSNSINSQYTPRATSTKSGPFLKTDARG